jgi:hypothetical protein
MTADPETVSIRRTPDGWRVHSTVLAEAQALEADDLLSAMVLGDLLGEVPLSAAPKSEEPTSEYDRLRIVVAQLQYALASRVLIEQAIGVVAERHQIRPGDAYERIRQVGRSGGQKVLEVSRLVVASVTDRAVDLPAELCRRG